MTLHELFARLLDKVLSLFPGAEVIDHAQAGLGNLMHGKATRQIIKRRRGYSRREKLRKIIIAPVVQLFQPPFDFSGDTQFISLLILIHV